MKHRSVRAPFVITASIALTVAACGGTANGGGGSGGSGAASGSGGAGGSGATSGSGGSGGNAPECPTEAPQDGTACAVPGTECQFDRCGPEGLSDIIVSCEDGVWVERLNGTCNPPPPEECPSQEPSYGSYCEVDESRYCSYPTSECCPDTDARCIDNAWEVSISSCNPPPPPPCPEEMPVDGADCSPEDSCGYTVQTCVFGACGDTPQVAEAFCDGQQWNVKEVPCSGAE